jgi:hypothetical protein
MFRAARKGRALAVARVARSSHPVHRLASDVHVVRWDRGVMSHEAERIGRAGRRAVTCIA